MLETGGHALFLAVDAERRADSEGFWRIETRAKSNSAVLPSKLEPFNRRQSVRDRAFPLLFRIEYTPFYVATRPRSVDGKPASAISSCILNGLRGFDFLPQFKRLMNARYTRFSGKKLGKVIIGMCISK